MTALELDPVSKKIISGRNTDVDSEVDEIVVDAGVMDLMDPTKDFFFIDNQIIVKDYNPELLFNKIHELKKKCFIQEQNTSYDKILSEFAERDIVISSETVFAEVNKRYTDLKKQKAELKALEKRYEHEKKAAVSEINRQRSAKIQPIYYSAVCLLTKDENEYLPEWLTHHLEIGFDHIYIYDNGSKIPVQRTVNQIAGIDKERITVINFSGIYRHTQLDCYRHCLQTYRRNCRWIAYFDTDEFIDIRNGKKINEFLKDYEDVGGLHIAYEVYNADGQLKKTKGLLRERFKKSRFFPAWGKCIVHTPHAREVMIHYPILHKDSIIVNEFHQDFETQASWRHEREDSSIVIQHYFTKSYEEWIAKLKRGTADPWFARRNKEFFDHNPDLIEYYDKSVADQTEYNHGGEYENERDNT